MSSLTIVGFFALANGERVVSTKPNSTVRTAHCIYTTAVQCSPSVALPAQIRVYSPQNDVPLADGLVAFVVAKAAFPLHESVLLDAYFVVPLPGDPTKEEYDDGLPDMPFPLLFGLGSVPFKTEERSNGARAFQVAVAEYVRDSTKASNVECLYTTPRWSNPPAPNVNSSVEFIGTLARVTPTGLPGIDLLNIVLNAGAPVAAGPGAPGPHTPKRKRFSAFAASPSTPGSTSTPAGSSSGDAVVPASGSSTAAADSQPACGTSAPEPMQPLTIRLRSGVTPSEALGDALGEDERDTEPAVGLNGGQPSAKALGKRKSMK